MHLRFLLNDKAVTEGTGIDTDNGETVEELTESFYADDMGWDFDEIWTRSHYFPLIRYLNGKQAQVELQMSKKPLYNVYVTTDGIRAEGLNGNERFMSIRRMVCWWLNK